MPDVNITSIGLQAFYREQDQQFVVMTERGYRTFAELGITITGGGGTGGGGDASAANQVAPLGTVTPGTAATKSTLGAGVYNTTAPAMAAGNQVAEQCDERGNKRVRIHATTFAPTDGYSNALFSAFNGPAEATGGTRPLMNGLLVFNDTTWDRLRGDTFGLRVQPAKRAGTNRSKLITTTSSEVIPANANSWFLANDSTVNIGINIGANASATDTDTEGTFLLRPGERLSSRDVVETGAVNAIVASGTARLKARST